MYDLIIIGAGPAGLTASIYASRYGLKHAIVGTVIGGTALEACEVCNFPTEIKIKGYEISQKMQLHAEILLGKKIIPDTVVSVKEERKIFYIQLLSGKLLKTKTILLATGTNRRHLNVPGEKEFLGKGVSYCAACDAMFFKNKTVAVIGGSDSATTAAITLSQICKQVFLIYRKKELRGETAWIEAVKKTSNITVIYQTNVTEIKGSASVDFLLLDKPFQKSNQLKVNGVFIEIGSVPNTTLLANLNVKTDSNSYIVVNNQQQTSHKGIWAAGDCTTASDTFKQIITACAEGTIAVFNIFKALKKT